MKILRGRNSASPFKPPYFLQPPVLPQQVWTGEWSVSASGRTASKRPTHVGTWLAPFSFIGIRLTDKIVRCSKWTV